MKHLTNVQAIAAMVFICLLKPGSMQAAEPRSTFTLEQKMASIDAGRLVDPRDTSVARMKVLLKETASVYRIEPIRVADMAAALKRVTTEHGSPVTIAEALDWALIACEHICSEKDLSENMAVYASSRKIGQTHHHAVHGLVILKYVAKVVANRRN